MRPWFAEGFPLVVVVEDEGEVVAWTSAGGRRRLGDGGEPLACPLCERSEVARVEGERPAETGHGPNSVSGSTMAAS